jgi:cellulose synthase (UDP-forming)
MPTVAAGALRGAARNRDVESNTQGPVADPTARYASLTRAQQLLVALFVVVGLWYLGWRPTTFNPEAPVFSWVVYGGEIFGFVCALLYLYMCWRLKFRVPPPVPANASVAVFVPTINESVEIVRRTLLSARRMKHSAPVDVWLLDDGNRPEMRRLAKELGCLYLARSENSHAKAGNLNNALRHTKAEYIAIFDADHAPAPAFLEQTLGFFRDPKVAFVQTPQDFYNLDSFQHRLEREDSLVWSEQTLFFRVIQAGKDRLNSAFFCGSCAVIRRAALDDIGGFATGTVTEDIHTSLKLHKRGWNSVYYARSLAFGLAPASVLPFLKQRLRWGQGAMQVWRQEGIVFARGLTFSQRVSYLATILAYFEGWQRAVFFVAPVVVLSTGVMPVAAMDAEFLARFIPYYLLTFWVFEEVARGHGRTLLTEQYNMMRFAVFITATFGFFLRRLRFVVTPKQMGEREATKRTLWPQYLILVATALSVPVGVLAHWLGGGLPVGALVANVLWATLTCGIAASAIRYALRTGSSRRREYRFPLPMPLRVLGSRAAGVGLASDISPQGFRLVGAPAEAAAVGDEFPFELMLPEGRVRAGAHVVAKTTVDGTPALGCQIRWGSETDCHQLEAFLFGSDLQWQLNGWSERIRTPLDRLNALLGHRPAESGVPKGLRWSPLVTGEGEASASVGFISDPASEGGTRTVVAMRALPRDRPLLAEEVTAGGARAVAGAVHDEQRVETNTDPLYVYRLTA